MSAQAAAETKPWAPPTPQSELVPMPAPPPPMGHFEPLPPPLASLPTPLKARSHSLDRLLNGTSAGGDERSSSERMQVDERATPSSLVDGPERKSSRPVLGFFEADEASALRPALAIKETRTSSSSATTLPQFHDTPHASSSTFQPPPPSHEAQRTTSLRKRPRREAAIPKPVERQPSPLDLSPPLRPTGSNRKVSHSLIERRRREKINDCLATLKEIVPNCREETERKEARARERGRKRGRKNDDGEEDGARGGLHKLEVLQGTIEYIRELEARIEQLEREEESDLLTSASASASPGPISAIETISRVTTASPFSSASEPLAHSQNPGPRALLSASQRLETLLPTELTKSQGGTLASILTTDKIVESEAETALLLLNFSTSPELRPVFFNNDH